MTSSADGNSDFLSLGVFKRDGNVLLRFGLNDERWAHAVVVQVAGSGILGLDIIIVVGVCCDLETRGDSCNVNRHARGVFALAC